MAVLTPLDLSAARRIAAAHGLGPPSRVVPVAAGSVNSNFFLVLSTGRVFCRLYEEQDADGVAYEWALLDHLRRAGLPVPRRLPGPGPGELRVAGKPVALFEEALGSESCQAGVTPSRAEAVGAFLAGAHLATSDFPQRRAGRFGPDELRRRLEDAARAGRPELAPAIGALRAALDQAWATPWPRTPRGVVHGDLFRDNVRWEGDVIAMALDWESAADGDLVYDLAVTILAWCFDDALRWDLARALARGYDRVRPLSRLERAALGRALIAAAARFGVTRIGDYYLRQTVGDRVHKDYRRFLARLAAVQALEDRAVAEALLG